MILGTEMEYAIWAPDVPDADPDRLAALVVDSLVGPATRVRAGVHHRMLGNGARFYVDHGHPEYSAPETTNPSDAAAHDHAGDLIVARAAAAASEKVGTRIKIARNNTDGAASYGHHENVLLPRRVPWQRIEALLPAFLVTRIVFSGAGRVGLGVQAADRPDADARLAASNPARPGFQLSQRADFFTQLTSLNTMADRGLLNTRDEPLAAGRHRRLHLIAGDANRNPYATWLKLGTLGLVCAVLESDAHAGALTAVTLADPVGAFRTVSRDLSLRTPLPLADGGRETALGVQRRYLDAVAALAGQRALAEADHVLHEWAQTLDDLERDPASTADRLDWTAKHALLSALSQRHRLAAGDPKLAALDLAWAELTPTSPFEALRRSGRLLDWIGPAAIAGAAENPPSDTRAWARGQVIARHADAIEAADWDALVLNVDGRRRTLRLSEPLSHSAADFDLSEGLDTLGAP